MKISVIIPVYNGEKYIEKALLSVVDQNYVDEIILIDDKSTDKSRSIAEALKVKYPDKIVLLNHYFPNNVGAGKSRNIGIKAAKNEWLAFLDVDDYYLPNRFSNSVALINEFKDADGIYEAVENVFENDAAYQRFCATRPTRYQTEQLKKKLTLFTLDEKVSPDDLFKYLMDGNGGFFHFNGVLIRKSLFEKAGYLNEDLELTQDTDVFFKMAMIGNLYSGDLDNAVAARLVHDNNRVYANDEKLKFFRLKKYHGFIDWAKNHKLSADVHKIILEKNIKLCAAEVLEINIYSLYRIKHFFIRMFYPLIMSRFFKREGKKYLKK